MKLTVIPTSLQPTVFPESGLHRSAAAPAPRRLSVVPAASPPPVESVEPPVQTVEAPPVQTLEAPPAVQRPRFDAAPLNKLIVSSYKVMGFAVLTTILLGLASFIASHVFYYVNHSWIAPTVLSQSDPRVVQLRSSYAAEAAHRDALLQQVFDLEARQKDAARIARVEEAFEAKYKLAARADLDDRKHELSALETAEQEYAGSIADVVAAGKSFSGLSRVRLHDDYSAHLIDSDAMLSGTYQLTQIAGARVQLRERDAETLAKVADLRRQVSSLTNAANGEMPADREVNYEVLRMTRDYDQSLLARQKAGDDGEAIGQSLAVLRKTIADYDRLLGDIQAAPYLIAARGDVPLAVVPYENEGASKEGAPVFACRFGLVGCAQVGHVGPALDGEVVGRHPLFNRDMRGRMVRLALDDPRGIESSVLHVGRAPLGL